MAHELEFAHFSFGTQVRKSPYSDAALRWGAKGFSVYNHMYIPRDFGDPAQNFWNLITSAILCDVSVERQVEIKGPDAAKFRVLCAMYQQRGLRNEQSVTSGLRLQQVFSPGPGLCG